MDSQSLEARRSPPKGAAADVWGVKEGPVISGLSPRGGRAAWLPLVPPEVGRRWGLKDTKKPEWRIFYS